ncbi:MAG: hypothetical protein KDH88_02425 [Chromatiales bacterium]|nr:hypothetical protein [Chromatiales bacterium]
MQTYFHLKPIPLGVSLAVALSSVGVGAANGNNGRNLQGTQNAITLQQDARAIARRGDVIDNPAPLRDRLVEMAGRPHSLLPTTIFNEAEGRSELFQYYLLDTTGFQPNIWTARIPGINDRALQTGANAANDGLPTIGAVRLVLEPKPGLPTDPDDPGAFIDVFTDISGLFVINNESGWYEGWMIQDIPVPSIAEPRVDGSAQFNTITPADAAALAAMGSGNNVPGNIFTVDGEEARFPSAGDVFPDIGKNTIAHPVSMGAWNTLQQSDGHAYWEFNSGTNWIFPHYEIIFSGGVPGTYVAGLQYENLRNLQTVIPGSGPFGITNDKVVYGDDPDNPRDPDRTEAEPGSGQAEFRLRFNPSAVDREILYNVFLRTQSFHPGVTSIPDRFFLSYAAEVAKVDQNGDGVISFEEADVNGSSDGQPNTRLYLSPREFNRFAVTREINDALLAPRFAPSERAYVLSGFQAPLAESVEASVPVDADLR